MNFKKPKDAVIEEATQAAGNVLYNHFYELKTRLSSSPVNSNIDQLQWAMQAAFRAAIKSLVENTYTDNDFEEDMELK